MLYNKSLDKKIEIIKSKQINKEKTNFKQRFIKLGILYPVTAAAFKYMDRLFRVDETCNGCGVCMNVSPACNISIKRNKPVFHHKCEQYSAYINRCPFVRFNAQRKQLAERAITISQSS